MALAPVYLVSSDDPLLKNEREDQIVAQAHAELPEAERMLFTWSDFSGGGRVNLTALENELLDPGLFGGDRIIKIFLKDLDRTAIELIRLVVRRHRPGVCIILDLPRLNAVYFKGNPEPLPPDDEASATRGGKGAKKPRKVSLETEKKHAIAWLKYIGADVPGPMYAPEGPDLVGYIRNRARNIGLNMRPDACEYLAALSSGNLTAAVQALNMLRIINPDHPVTPEDLEEVTAQDSRFSPFEFTTALFSADTTRALAILALLGHGSDASANLGMMSQLVDKALVTVREGRLQGIGRLSYREQTPFFRAHGINGLTTQKALVMAINSLPVPLLDFLTHTLAATDLALQNFDLDKARLGFARMIVGLQNIAAARLEPL